MDAQELYATVLGSLLILILGWQIAKVGDAFRRRVAQLIRKHLVQTLIVTRRKGSSDYTVGSGVAIILLITGNIVAVYLHVKSLHDVTERLKAVFHVNLIPLCIGVRAPVLANTAFGFTLKHHSLMHRSLGWICLFEGLGYLGLSLASEQWKVKSYSFGITIAMLVLGITSLLYIRRSFHETFLKLHLAISIGIIACLLLQTTQVSDFHSICLLIATGLWSFEKAIWLGRIVLDHMRKIDELTVISTQDDVGSDVTMVEVRSHQPRQITHGQHVFITVPSIPHYMVGTLQAHPYMIAWEHRDGSCQVLTLLIAHRSGFSNVIRLCKSGTRMRLDGPYGGTEGLERFDKVFFIASGVGVAAHLLAIRHLVQTHNDKTSRVRRLSLLWFLETDDQELWARRFLFELMKQDSERRIFTVYLYRPFRGKNSSIPTFTQPYAEHQRIYDARSALDVDWLVQEEWAAEAGTMAVSLCGSPMFERRVRNTLRKSPHDIKLVTSSFQMDESTSSMTASFRFRNIPKPDRHHDSGTL